MSVSTPRELRREFFFYLLRNHPNGAIMPRWARIIHWILFPIQSLHWHQYKHFGYDIYSDTYRINGARFSAKGLYRLTVSNGELFRAERTGEVITITRTHPGELEKLAQQRAQLAAFARDILESWPESSALDGGDIQEYAVKHGLLVGSVVHEPCNGGDPDKACACSDYCMADEFAEGVTCYRRTDLVKGGEA